MSATSRNYTAASGFGASNRADGSAWGYSVPAYDNISPTSDSADPYDLTTNSSRRQAPQQSTGYSRRPPANDTTGSNSLRTKPSVDSARLQPPANDQDRASSGDDSLLDLYHSHSPVATQPPSMGQSSISTQPNGRKRVASRERSKVRRKGSRSAVSTMQSPPEEGRTDEESQWIHRDKLAQIESRELAEMGIRVGRPSRAGSRSKSVRTTRSTTDVQEMAPELPEDEDPAIKESRRLHQVVDDDMEEARMQDEADNFASHVSQRSQDRIPASRPGTSRIPIPAGSLDEDSPIESRRNGSGTFGAQRQRTRSRSGGSQHLLDGTNGTNGFSTPSSPQRHGSPPKPRTASKGIPTPTNRKASAPRKTSAPGARSRANSTTDSPKRPTTSGGSRPPTARPEGEAPWIATMYKPDPLLPQEEQMLPTHAKRMAQAQMEAQARAAREKENQEFTLLDSNEEKENQAPVEHDPVGALQNQNGSVNKRSSVQQKRSSLQDKRSSMQEKRDSGQWPLRTPSQQGSDKRLSPRPDGSEHGGYNLMPHVPPHDPEKRASTQPSHRSRGSQGDMTENERRQNAAMAPVNQPVRLHPDEDEPKKKSSGCCCVVM